MVKLEYLIGNEVVSNYAEAVKKSSERGEKIIKRYRPFELSPAKSEKRFYWKNGKRVKGEIN